MAQRHPNDTVERLWPGATDPTNPRFVPLELRDVVADIPADIEQQLRRELYGTGEMIRTDGRRKATTINPSTEPDDLETALVWRKCQWAARQLVSQRQDAERAAHDAIHYTCAVCRKVRTPGIGDQHTRSRRFPDGTRATVCGECAPVVERLAVDRLAAEVIDGHTRSERAGALLERSRP